MRASTWQSSCLNAATVSGTQGECDKERAHVCEWERGTLPHAKYKAAASSGLPTAGAVLRELMSSATDLWLHYWQVTEPVWDSVFRCMHSGKQKIGSLNIVLSAPQCEGRVPPLQAACLLCRDLECQGEWEDPLWGADSSGEDMCLPTSVARTLKEWCPEPRVP